MNPMVYVTGRRSNIHSEAEVDSASVAFFARDAGPKNRALPGLQVEGLIKRDMKYKDEQLQGNWIHCPFLITINIKYDAYLYAKNISIYTFIILYAYSIIQYINICSDGTNVMV